MHSMRTTNDKFRVPGDLTKMAHLAASNPPPPQKEFMWVPFLQSFPGSEAHHFFWGPTLGDWGRTECTKIARFSAVAAAILPLPEKSRDFLRP